MNYKLIIVPVMSALIGYVTNWIAVKMLFRPRREIRIRGHRLPFTPGVIPRGQSRLARAVGRAVDEQLLTVEVMERVLLSEDKKEMIRDAVKGYMEELKASGETLQGMACKLLSEEKTLALEDLAQEKISGRVYRKVMSMDLGKNLTEKALEAAKEKLAGSMIGMFVSGSMLDAYAPMIEEKIEEFMTTEGKAMIEHAVREETEALLNGEIGTFVQKMEPCEIDYADIVINAYEKVVKEKLPQALRAIDFATIVEDRINAMEVEEVEDLMMSIMKKELGAIVNLGALIGLVLGLVNVALLVI